MNVVVALSWVLRVVRTTLPELSQSSILNQCSSSASFVVKKNLSPQDGPGQAGRPAAAVDADFAAGKGAHIKSRFPQPLIGAGILFDGQQASFAQRQNIAGQRVTLRRMDLYQAEAA